MQEGGNGALKLRLGSAASCSIVYVSGLLQKDLSLQLGAQEAPSADTLSSNVHFFFCSTGAAVNVARLARA